MLSRFLVYAAAMILAASWIGDVRDVAPVPALGPEAIAQARSAKASRSKRSQKKRDKSRRARRARARHNNMPKGWQWPPSDKMAKVGAACLEQLDERGIVWRKARAAKKIATPVTLPAMEIGGLRLVSTYRKGPFVMDCHLVLGLANFAETLHGLGVRELHFSRIHDYTKVRVNGEVKRALSRHALGIAIDIRAFVDETGHTSVVETDYPLGDQLLLDVEQALNDAGTFRTILTPGNDPASHDDHYHVEVGVDYTATRHARRAEAP